MQEFWKKSFLGLLGYQFSAFSYQFQIQTADRWLLIADSFNENFF